MDEIVVQISAEAWHAARTAGPAPTTDLLTLGPDAHTALEQARPTPNPEVVELRCPRLVALELAVWLKGLAARARDSADPNERVRGLSCETASLELKDAVRGQPPA